MANYNKQKKSVGRVVAGVLCGVLCVAAVAGAGTALYMGATNNGWFDSEEIEENDNVVDESVESAKSIYVSNGESHGITLTATKLTANAEEVEEENEEEYGIMTASLASSYTLTATYNEGATNPTFTWTASGSGVTLTPSSDTKSCTVTCSGAFSSQITITCTADDNSSVYATCTADYVKRLSASYLNVADDTGEYDSFVIGSTSSTYGTWAPTSDSVYGATLMPSVMYSRGTGTVNESYTTSVTYYSNIANTSTQYTLNIGTGLSPVTFLSNITGVSSSLSSASFLLNVYNKLVQYTSNTDAAARFTITCTGLTTGETFTRTVYMYIDYSNLYTQVSSVSLSNTSLTF